MIQYVFNPFTGNLDAIGSLEPTTPTDPIDPDPDTPNPNDYIVFEDAEVERICIENWSSDGIGLTYEDAALIKSLNNSFTENITIQSFNELIYFTGLTIIEINAFAGCNTLLSITLPNSITTINNVAFEGCEILSSLTIPENVTFIGISITGGCNNLKTLNYNAINCLSVGVGIGSCFSSSIEVLNIGNQVKAIPDYAFSILQSLTSIHIPNSVITIGNESFYFNSATELTGGINVESLGTRSFGDSNGLSNINIFPKLTTIPANSFSSCDSLASVSMQNEITTIEEQAFNGCTVLETINLSNNLSIIGDSVFANCPELKTITLPNSLTNLGSSAFYNCHKFNFLICNAIIPPLIPENSSPMFYLSDALVNIYVPAESVDAYKTAEGWSDYAEFITAIAE